MSASVNKVIIIGNLGKDPDIKHTQSGEKIANLYVATTESWKDKATGEKKDKTEWHKVVIFNDAIANAAAVYLKKGSKVYIEGQLQNREWMDNDIKRYTTEIVITKFRGSMVMLGSNADKSQGTDTNFDTPTQSSSRVGGEDIPF